MVYLPPDVQSKIESELNDGQLQVFKALQTSEDGLTCEEVETKLTMKHQTASARIRELQDLGIIEDRGIRRKTTSGRPAAVWILTRP